MATAFTENVPRYEVKSCAAFIFELDVFELPVFVLDVSVVELNAVLMLPVVELAAAHVVPAHPYAHTWYTVVAQLLDLKYWTPLVHVND
jgi:hypothetical protein